MSQKWNGGIKQKIHGLIFGVFALLALTLPALTHADSPAPTWLDDTKNPEYSIFPTEDNSVRTTQDDFDKLMDQHRFLPTQGCVQKTFPVNNARTDLRSGCWFNTKLGWLERSGYLLKPSSSTTAGFINNTESRLLPTNNEDVFLEILDDPVNDHVHIAFRTVDDAAVSRTANPWPDSDPWNDDIWFSWTHKATYTPIDASGQPVTINYSSIFSTAWVSSDGSRLLLWDPQGYFYAINLQSFLVQVIQATEPGQSPGSYAELDTTPDGKYIVVSQNNGPLTVIATDSCNLNPSKVFTRPSVCQSRTLEDILSENYLNSGYLLPKFFGDDAISYYARDLFGGYYINYFQAPNTNALNTKNYLALGDSFSSGEGAFDYEDGTDVHDKDPQANKCHLSKNSYPYLLNQDIAFDSFHSVACSGAVIRNVVGDAEGNNAKQFNQPVPNPLGDFEPGIISQLAKVNKYEPNILTISMVGNDVGFADKLTYCVEKPDSCFSSYEDRVEIVNEINNKFDKLVDMYKQIRRASAPKARIYVVGYPQIVSSATDARCAANVHLTENERALANDLTTYLNSVIKQATLKAGVRYVGVEGSLDGHRLCEASPPQVAVNGITLGDDAGVGKVKFVGKESFHPNALGYQLMEQAILKQTHDLTDSMPIPEPASTVPSKTNQPLLNAPFSGRPINLINYDDNPKNNVIYRGEYWQDFLDANVYGFTAFANYKIYLHSDPIELGEVTSDMNGDLDLNLAVPTSVPVGFHVLHIYGPDTSGQPLDVYRYVYVAASEQDWDGDGILNQDEPCGILDPAGIDSDKDGIDDACDPAITTPLPSTPLPTVTTSNTQHGATDITSMYLTNTLVRKPFGFTQTATTDSAIPSASSITKTMPTANAYPGKIPSKSPAEPLLVLVTGIIGLTLFGVMRYARHKH